MQANRPRDTKPELALRRAVHARGLRYFVNRRPVPAIRRTADLLFPRRRLAVFLDGCFWHGCLQHHTVAKANSEYWAAKVVRNRDRDADTDRVLAAAGWTVLRIWEHVPTEEAAELVAKAVSAIDVANQVQTSPSAGHRLTSTDPTAAPDVGDSVQSADG
jgi:DNA mismatch endonuclease (patch repair protein)